MPAGGQGPTIGQVDIGRGLHLQPRCFHLGTKVPCYKRDPVQKMSHAETLEKLVHGAITVFDSKMLTKCGHELGKAT